MSGILDLFDLTDRRVAVIGGKGLLGQMAAQTVLDLKGEPIVIDKNDQIELESCTDVINCAIGNQQPVEHPSIGLTVDLDVGLLQAAAFMQLAYEPLKAAQGTYLNIGSDLSMKAPDHKRYAPKFKPVSYSIVKHGIIGLTRYYARLWGPEGIRVNCLCPGSIDQGQAVPDCALGRLAKPYEMKGAIAWLLSEASSYVTGAIINVDGGSTL